eukprot:2150506-Prorocentrum_lima.AAC.1
MRDEQAGAESLAHAVNHVAGHTDVLGRIAGHDHQEAPVLRLLHGIGEVVHTGVEVCHLLVLLPLILRLEVRHKGRLHGAVVTRLEGLA